MLRDAEDHNDLTVGCGSCSLPSGSSRIARMVELSRTKYLKKNKKFVWIRQIVFLSSNLPEVLHRLRHWHDIVLSECVAVLQEAGLVQQSGQRFGANRRREVANLQIIDEAI